MIKFSEQTTEKIKSIIPKNFIIKETTQIGDGVLIIVGPNNSTEYAYNDALYIKRSGDIEIIGPNNLSILSESVELKHYGTPRHSGRYPWGSGKDPYQPYWSPGQERVQGTSQLKRKKQVGMKKQTWPQ